jgi:hypothetical protein
VLILRGSFGLRVNELQRHGVDAQRAKKSAGTSSTSLARREDGLSRPHLAVKMRQSLRSARWCSRTFSTNAHADTVNPRPPPRNVQELCRQSVQDRDKDHFACLSFLPAKAREAAFTVRAFNIELAMLRDVAKVAI